MQSINHAVVITVATPESRHGWTRYMFHFGSLVLVPYERVVICAQRTVRTVCLTWHPEAQPDTAPHYDIQHPDCTGSRWRFPPAPKLLTGYALYMTFTPVTPLLEEPIVKDNAGTLSRALPSRGSVFQVATERRQCTRLKHAVVNVDWRVAVEKCYIMTIFYIFSWSNASSNYDEVGSDM
jgi:hypothetical protein